MEWFRFLAVMRESSPFCHVPSLYGPITHSLTSSHPSPSLSPPPVSLPASIERDVPAMKKAGDDTFGVTPFSSTKRSVNRAQKSPTEADRRMNRVSAGKNSSQLEKKEVNAIDLARQKLHEDEFAVKYTERVQAALDSQEIPPQKFFEELSVSNYISEVSIMGWPGVRWDMYSIFHHLVCVNEAERPFVCLQGGSTTIRQNSTSLNSNAFTSQAISIRIYFPLCSLTQR